MQSTKTTGGPELKISVAAPPLWTYLAGDIIIGSVNRSSHIVATDATISLSLIGVAKARLITDGYPIKSTHYGDWQLFKLPSQILRRGPMHIPEPSSPPDWINIPFSIKIPRMTSSSALRDHAQYETFIPLEEGQNARYPLPGTYSTEWTGAKVCIEYYLQAKLQYTRKGCTQIQRATAPITLGHPTIDPAAIRFALQRCSITSKVRSQRLLPSMHGVDLSLTQKTQKLLGLSSVPGLSFQVVMSVPIAIQLDNPSPIPLYIRVIPQWDGTSCVIRDVEQKVQIGSMKMILLSKVEIILKPSEASLYMTPKDERDSVQSLGLEKAFGDLQDPIVTFVGPSDTPADVGNVLQLVLRRDGLWSGGKLLSPLASIEPSFVTFNIRLSHSILWQASLNIAGETRNVSMKADVTLYNSAMRL